jgi:hypothetical protein
MPATGVSAAQVASTAGVEPGRGIGRRMVQKVPVGVVRAGGRRAGRRLLAKRGTKGATITLVEDVPLSGGADAGATAAAGRAVGRAPGDGCRKTTGPDRADRGPGVCDEPSAGTGGPGPARADGPVPLQDRLPAAARRSTPPHAAPQREGPGFLRGLHVCPRGDLNPHAR